MRGDHVELARHLVDDLRRQGPTVHTDGKWWQYDDRRGIFVEVVSSHLSTIVQGYAGAIVGSGKGSKALKLKAADVHGAMKLASDQAHDPDYFTQSTRGIAFADCFADVQADRITQREHSPEHRCRFAYAFDYSPAADPATFLQFLHDVFRDDPDREQKICLIQEFIGVSLLGEATRYQRAIVMVGEGANGKGVFASVVERCMPPGSVCAIPPQEAGQEYRRAMLAGKLLNVVSELPEADILDSESWKAIVAGDTTTGREIRGAPFTFKPIAGHIYAANRLPGTSDQTHGFWRRLLVVRFNRVFSEMEQDPGLADRIVETDRQRIVSWALRGAQRVLCAGSFTMPESARARNPSFRNRVIRVTRVTRETRRSSAANRSRKHTPRPDPPFSTPRRCTAQGAPPRVFGAGRARALKALALTSNRKPSARVARTRRLNQSCNAAESCARVCAEVTHAAWAILRATPDTCDSGHFGRVAQ